MQITFATRRVNGSFRPMNSAIAIVVNDWVQSTEVQLGHCGLPADIGWSIPAFLFHVTTSSEVKKYIIYICIVSLQ